MKGRMFYCTETGAGGRIFHVPPEQVHGNVGKVSDGAFLSQARREEGRQNKKNDNGS